MRAIGKYKNKDNEQLLKSWCEMEDWGDYLERRGALGDFVSDKEFKAIEKEYFDEVMRRINYCKGLLETHKDALVYYTLAELYDRCNPDESADYLFKHPVRYYAIKAIREDRQYAAAWALLAEAYSWMALLGGESNTIPKIEASFEKNKSKAVRKKSYITHSYTLTEKQKREIRYIEKAILYVNKALEIEPFNGEYQRLLKYYHNQRNQEYKPEDVPRIMMLDDKNWI